MGLFYDLDMRAPYELVATIILDDDINMDLFKLARGLRAITIIFGLITGGVIFLMTVAIIYLYFFRKTKIEPK